MRLELVWGDGISILVDLPKKVTGSKFLEIIEELEFLIKRHDKKRMGELTTEMEKMRNKELRKGASKHVLDDDQRREYKEFLLWKKRQEQNHSRPPLPAHPTPQPVQQPMQAYQQPVQPPMQYYAYPQQPQPMPQPAAQPPQDGLQDRLARLESHTERIIDFLDNLQ